LRLTRITTRTGDSGTTGLGDGTRVGKDHARIALLGSVDELNSQLGVLLAEELPQDIRDVLVHIQHDLFDLGGALSLPHGDSFPPGKIAWLDDMISNYNATLPPLREFVLPGGSRAGATCQLARAVARRAERDLAALAQRDPVPGHALPYLNRLSDLLFVLGRRINTTLAVPEVMWQRKE
jgi:cob(I)alamin adenosyltransferase